MQLSVKAEDLSRQLVCQIEVKGEGFVMLVVVSCDFVTPRRKLDEQRLVKAEVAA